MHVQIRSTSVLDATLPLLEKRCADTDVPLRRRVFYESCENAGLPGNVRIVRALADDLEHIRPTDVWLRIIADQVASGDKFPTEQLDHGLAALRLADAYVRRSAADAAVAASLCQAVALLLPHASIAEWGEWEMSDHRDFDPATSLLDHCRLVGRYSPLTMVTRVSAHYASWVQPFVDLSVDFAALDYLCTNIVASVQGKRGVRGLAEHWRSCDTNAHEVPDLGDALNTLAESVWAQWHDLQHGITDPWHSVMNEQFNDAINFAAALFTNFEGDSDGRSDLGS